uniref:hypothetical protein n=1 Tax=Agathobacter sp. TaxID=2021311 RepID=UPI0040578DCE
MNRNNKTKKENILAEDEITRYREAYSRIVLVPSVPGMPVFNGALFSDTTYLSLPW